MKFTRDYSAEIDRLKKEIQTADAIVIGAGAGLSTAAGFTYSGERLQKYFGDFVEKYGFQGGFISDSDAHDLIAIRDAERTLDVETMSPRGVIEAVRRLGETN